MMTNAAPLEPLARVAFTRGVQQFAHGTLLAVNADGTAVVADDNTEMPVHCTLADLAPLAQPIDAADAALAGFV